MTTLVRLPNWLGDLVMSGAFVRACAERGFSEEVRRRTRRPEPCVNLAGLIIQAALEGFPF
ncbi:MAG: hypothetical protein JXP48_14855 [Acidobacteria bacterium]|nr:hypothetical protein [Acidobacteriota bacterium]